MGTLQKLGRKLEEATGKRRSWNEILRACGGNEGIAYVVQGTLDGIADKKKPSEAFFDAVEDQNFYGDRPDVVQARNQAQRILEKSFGVKVPYVGEGLSEAVKRQGQVLPTENESWGFYGTLSQSMPDTAQMNDIWVAAFKAFLEAFPGIDSKVVREFLDSKGGRHFADAIMDDAVAKGDPAKVGKAVKAALRGGEGAWVAKELARMAGTPMGVAPGGTAEMAQRVKAVTVAFAAVQAEELKKNWKQQADAMHALEKAADALVTATRAWFSNSGRATAHEVWRGPGQKVRVTIPEDAAVPAANIDEGK